MSTKPQPTTISQEQASAQGYRPITTEYKLPSEQWMLDNVLADMRRGSISHAVVQQANGPEVWRRASL